MFDIFGSSQVFLSVVMDNVKTNFGTYTGMLTTLIATVWALVNKYREIIAWITLRVEKDAQDGWTAEEKEAFAIDLYFNQLLPKLPPQYWLIKMIPRFISEKIIRNLVRLICKKTAKLKVQPK